jgi:two-component system cell cycle sensor histidine kinase/response regulator CckA
MSTLSILSIGIILCGAAVMFISLLYSLKTYRVFSEFDTDELSTLNHFNTVHKVLMIFFLLGYFAVAVAIYTKTDVISEIFVSIIFFFGAVFVFLGIRMQSAMNTMLRNRYNIARHSADALQKEQQELLRANKLLEVEVKEREQAEIMAGEREKRLKQILDNLPIGVLIIDAKTLKIKEANPMAESMMGAVKSDIVGCQCQAYVFGANMNNCPMLRFPDKNNQQGDYTLMRPEGTELPILKTVSRIELEGEPHFLEAFLDMSEKKRLEEQLQRSQKLEAVGLLAGGVAHDLNNILSGLLSYPELILMGVDESDPLRKPLETIKRSGEKAAVIVQDLLLLARQNVAAKEPTNLSTVIQEFLASPEFERMCARHTGVNLTTSHEKELMLIEGSPVHLSKVAMNLIFNAVEAIPGKGSVQITTENRYIDTPISGYKTVVEGDYVVLTVQDDGNGISSQDMPRIFEPFYSRKVLGQSGSGLGMAIVWNTVKDHQGYIEVESFQNKGTILKVYFPATERVLLSSDKQEADNFPKGQGQAVLVVDDIEEQREIAGSMLKYLNYSVDVAISGEAALETLKHKQYDLILLDMIMEPGIDGLETYRKITDINPTQKVILVSGYSDPSRLDSLKELGLRRYIRKPYTLKVLSENVHTTLGGPSTIVAN